MKCYDKWDTMMPMCKSGEMVAWLDVIIFS